MDPRSRRAPLLALCLFAPSLVAAGGCGSPATWLLLTVDAEEEVSSEAGSLELLVISADDRSLIERRVFAVPRDLALPAQVLFEPRDEPSARLYVIAHAYASPDGTGEPLGAALALFAYEEGRGSQYRLRVTADAEAAP